MTKTNLVKLAFLMTTNQFLNWIISLKIEFNNLFYFQLKSLFGSSHIVWWKWYIRAKTKLWKIYTKKNARIYDKSVRILSPYVSRFESLIFNQIFRILSELFWRSRSLPIQHRIRPLSETYYYSRYVLRPPIRVVS